MATQTQTQTNTQNQTFLPSPTSSTSSSSNNNNGGNFRHSHPPPLPSPRTPKPYQNPTQLPVTRSESNPYPTTFVQADTTSFKQVVQMLTGSSETLKSNSNPNPNPKPSSNNPIPPIKTPTKSKPSSKLYERRNSLKNLKINPTTLGFGFGFGFGSSPRNSEILSPSILDFPALVLSPVTPLIPDPFNRSPEIAVDNAAEEKAIAEKGFFLHPSPANTPRDSEPRLLPLFPVTSPRVSSSSSGSHPSSSN